MCLEIYFVSNKSHEIEVIEGRISVINVTNTG